MVTKVLLKVELKPLTKKDKELLENMFKEWERLVKIHDSFVHSVYPTKIRKDNENDNSDNNNDNGKLLTEYDEGLKKYSYKFIDLVKREYGINLPYALTKERGLADIAYDNALTALKHRSLPDIRGLANSIPIRISKTPLLQNLKSRTIPKRYERWNHTL
ncbi:MAG: hypothetical protein QW684_02310 [Candidatus Nitrosocaldus sp.]